MTIRETNSTFFGLFLVKSHKGTGKLDERTGRMERFGKIVKKTIAKWLILW